MADDTSPMSAPGSGAQAPVAPAAAADGTRTPKATITDVAHLAGVSKKTVSRILNDEPHVRAHMRQRVEQAIRQLNYSPDPQAQALGHRRAVAGAR